MHYVIVVCNDDEDLGFIEEAFHVQPGNFSVRAFRSAQRVSRYLASLDDDNLPCLIIINNYLPDMDSLELLKKIRGQPSYRYIPVTIMAGFAPEHTIRGYYLAGANCFYRKPGDQYEWNHMADCLITLFCRV